MLKYFNLLLIPMLLSGFCLDYQSVQGQVGYRRDQINVLGAKFNKINIVETGLQYKAEAYNLYAEVEGNYGWILNHHSSNGSTYDASGALGYHFDTCYLTVTPLIGYASQQDRIRMHNLASQEVNGENEHLKGTLKQRWEGAWIGLELARSLCNWDFSLRGEYHFANLRSYVRFHFADEFEFSGHANKNLADGYKVKLGAKYQISSCINLGLVGTYSRFSTHRAHSYGHLFVANNIPSFVTFKTSKGTSTLNSYDIKAVIEYLF